MMWKKIINLFSPDRKNNTDKKAAFNIPEEDLIEVTTAEFEETNEFKTFISKSAKKVMMLNPYLSDNDIAQDKSKMGGHPNLNNFSVYPTCDDCQRPLNFVLQLYQSQFSNCYFPEGKNLFQLFRCPNSDCVTGDELNKYDQKMFLFYFNDNGKLNHSIEKPENIVLEDMEKEVPHCELRPTEETDFPYSDDYEGDELNIIDRKYGGEWSDYMYENYSAKTGTKYGGYPSWTQFPKWPKCTCGKSKEFIFQLSSEELEEHTEDNAYRWSPHGIMIGDVGNIYFFVCKKCGESTIETNWDCS